MQPISAEVVDDPLGVTIDSGITLDIPVGLKDVDQLMEQYANGLRFPSYFRHNWNSFEECLRDLEWLSESGVHRVLIRHLDVPLSEDGENARVYLSVLSGARLSPRLVTVRAIFPSSVRDTLVFIAKSVKRQR